MKKKLMRLIVFAVLLCYTGLVRAVPITIAITGQITGGYGSWGNIHVGSILTGTYTYDSATPNTSTYGYMGLYVQDSPYGIDFFVEGFEFKTVPSHTDQFKITIFNDSVNADSYEVRSNQNISLSNGSTVDYVVWGLHGPSSMISSTDLPIIAPVVSHWPDKYLYLYGTDTLGNGISLQGTVTQAVLVPEPLTGILLVIGVFLFKRRR